MNQILITKIKKTYKIFFKLQFIFSIIVALAFGIYCFFNYQKDKRLEEISEILSKNIEISKIYNIDNIALESSLYFCKIEIEKLKVNYPVFNELSEELLKMAPCKFYGDDINKNTNICIAGHNYNDNRFFSNLSKLENGDEIKLIDLEENIYIYKIFDIYETEENDVEGVIKKKRAYELTLLTCNNSNGKRIIIKAYCANLK